MAVSHHYRDLLRQVLRIEEGIRGYGPTGRAGGPPPRAVEVLEALASRYRPGDVVSLAAIRAATGVHVSRAVAIRRYWRSVDRWPYVNRRPARGRRKGGAS